ncbi:MAG: hypothetical protein N2109_00635 [Fimbriimonadales bacterium]|nr:hypothetical protein [Fimbriimonadales bacterium]
MHDPCCAGYPKASWSDWTLLSLSGDDAASWLNGQCTQDVLGAPRGVWVQTAFCDERGKVWSFGWLCREPERLLLAMDASQVDRLISVAEERIVLEDVRVERLSLTAALRGIGDAASLDSEAIPCGDFLLAFGESFEGSVDVDRDAWEIARGWPSAAEFRQNPLAHELGEDFLHRCVSFHKGCYVGQEVVARVQTRGRVHRRWVALRLREQPGPAAKVVGPRGREAPLLRCGQQSDGLWLASAFLGEDEAQPGEIVHVAWSGVASEAEVFLPGKVPGA